MPLNIDALPGRVRLWVWRHGAEQIRAVCLYLYGHWLHWCERNHWLHRQGRIEILQRCLAGLSLIIGLAMCVIRQGDIGSPLVHALDAFLLPFEQWADPRLQAAGWPLLALVRPHQVFGVVLVASSVSLLVAIYEWPMASERGRECDSGVADVRLQRLLQMHLLGHMLALLYWGGTGIIGFLAHPLTLPPYTAAYFAYNHYWLYRRNNAEYIRECYAVERARSERASLRLRTKQRAVDAGTFAEAGAGETAAARAERGTRAVPI